VKILAAVCAAEHDGQSGLTFVRHKGMLTIDLNYKMLQQQGKVRQQAVHKRAKQRRTGKV
jgi:hypothetical protein